MLNNLIKFLIENKLVAVLLLVLFVGWGTVNAPFGYALGTLPTDPVPVDAIPDIGENQQIVYTAWPGRSPQDIENQVTYPLTTALMGIPGVKTIRSNSMFGFSSIYVIFNEDTEFYWSRSRILEKLNALPANLLPDGANPALGPDATALGQIFWYTLEGRDESGKPTGGWDLHELRSIQDFQVKYALASAEGVSEVATIGGYVQEYQVDIDPERLRQFNISLEQVVRVVRQSNRDVGAQTLEINKAEYLVRGLGYIKSVADIKNTVISSEGFRAIRVQDVAHVALGPAVRRGILDKEGAEVVGGVVVARFGANPMQVIENVKEKINEISSGLPTKTLADGRESKLTLVPFYDRTELIQETLGTLEDALSLEVLVTALVILLMVFNLRASILIAGLLPVAILMVFIAMRYFNVDANIVALSGIAIAIGTMVDMGIILSENIIRHLRDSDKETPLNAVVYSATAEVSGAILTAVATTIISFIPVFTLTGAEGKLFRPLAFTKTFALIASLVVALLLLPPFAAFLFRTRTLHLWIKRIWNFSVILLGLIALLYGFWPGLLLLAFGTLGMISDPILPKWMPNAMGSIVYRKQEITIGITVIGILGLLTEQWLPFGFDRGFMANFFVVSLICLGLLGGFYLFRKNYVRILAWTLNHKIPFLLLPALLVVSGFLIMNRTGREFMPSLNEGSFLLMPTSMPHAGVEENRRVLQQLDKAVASLPEIETVVGKAGRTESALDPAPLSMYENIIQYKTEYILNVARKPERFKVNKEGLFELKNGETVSNPNLTPLKITSIPYETIHIGDLIPDPDGEYFRNWRPEIESPHDIWEEIVKVTRLPGVTAAPKLQPIETRLIMLQTGMRAPMGIKIKGPNLETIEKFGLELETVLKEVDGVKDEAVFADRIVGKPYLLIDIDRDKLMRYGVLIEDVNRVLEVALGGMSISQTIEGRERYSIRVRYPRELRDHPDDLKKVYIPVERGKPVPLGDLVQIRYEKGPQMIKSEDTFLVGYVLFDRENDYADGSVVQNAEEVIQNRIESGLLKVPHGVSYRFTGSYENQQRAERTLSVVVPLVLLLIFLILYFQFRSVGTSMMVFSGIAVAFAGGFLMIWLYGQDWFLNIGVFGENLRAVFQIHPINLSVAIWVGFIALFGIATDDGVVMATYLQQSFRGISPLTRDEIHRAVILAGERRIRPCLMTTATTVLALLPVLTSTGRGSDIMSPMAIPSFGGMLVALISLFVVPVLYSWREEIRLNRKLRRNNESFKG